MWNRIFSCPEIELWKEINDKPSREERDESDKILNLKK